MYNAADKYLVFTSEMVRKEKEEKRRYIVMLINHTIFLYMGPQSKKIQLGWLSRKSIDTFQQERE
jgi:hypothetical protein